MSGKAYTMSEMKVIVNYLNTRKAYGELKGRKLWTDLASTNITNRTWQSLKETFLKRILPDIHNPYYGLSRSEISSFKQGYDVDKRSNSKLEIQTISDDSNNSHAGNMQPHDHEKPSTSNNNEAEKPTGEKTSTSKLDARTRASTETIILENCYESPEDIQRDLESPNSDQPKDNGKEETQNKSLRDLITYAEPLTPMMQQVLDDFATEDELVEAELEIVESSKNTNKEINKIGETIVDNNKQEGKLTVEDRLSEIVHCSDSIKIPLGQQSKMSEDNSARIDSDLIKNGNHNDDSTKGDIKCDNVGNKKDCNKVFNDLINETATTQNTNNSSDTLLPGNQEALKNKNENTQPASAGDVTKDVSQKGSINSNSIPDTNKAETKPNTDKKRVLGLKNKSVPQSGAEVKQKDEKIKSGHAVEENNKNNGRTVDNLENKQADKVVENKEKITNINPCLSSVSLYEEQFNKTKYTDSDSSDNLIIINDVEDMNKGTEDKQEQSLDLVKNTNINDVVILKSHSESDGSNEENQENANAVNEQNQEKDKRVIDKKEREQGLARAFGFASDAISPRRKRKLSRRHRSPSYNQNESDSSEWTSDSDSEYVSPPRGRRNRHGRKYLKPKSARILSLEEEGGLFVMHGKRIYPLVKDGNIVKNYLTFSPESDTEDDIDYWKKKYKEERKKTEELKKLVEEAKVQQCMQVQPLAVATSARQSTLPQSPPKLVPIPDEPKVVIPVEKPKEETRTHDKPLKIKFTKNNEELQVEGSWSQIHPVLAEVMQIFHKDPETKEAEPTGKVNGKVETDEVLSLRSTPVDEEAVRKKVEKMEEEIFKEIEELDKSEREQEAESSSNVDSNVNKRKRVGRPRKSSTALNSADSSSSPSRAKRVRKTKELPGESLLSVPKPEAPKRRTRSPKVNKEESGVANEAKKKSPKRGPRKSVNQQPESTRVSTDNESEVRYMFPPAKKQNARLSISKNKTPNARSPKAPTDLTLENMLLNSIESTQGYQDSDGSPAKERIMLKRKRKLSLSTILHRGKQRRFVRRKSYPYVSDDASSESSNLSLKVHIKHPSDSLKSEVYRSESYQLLMPVKKRSHTNLPKIDELSPSFDHNVHDNDDLKVETFDMKNSIRSDGNSSNVSLPQSPELSIVENISISKELMSNIDDFPTINETQANNEQNSEIRNKYMMSAVDVTMPLMGQDCEIQKSVTPDRFDDRRSPAISESLLNGINCVNVTEGPTISDSLDSRLRNLLLESAKKMEVDTLETINEYSDDVARNKTETNKKAKAKKRCSTPHKRNSRKKSKIPDVEPVVEEERMEFCSYGGRKSCPPTIEMLPNIVVSENEYANKTGLMKKGRKKKDIIKVKILKPINKQRKVSPTKVTKNTSHDITTISVHTDSGINETGSALFLQDTDDSVDLIHNHSETCLQTMECVGDSIEIVDRDMSVISLNSQDAFEFKDAENIPPEVFCSNAHDGISITRVKSLTTQSTGDTIYHSPLSSELSANSLITEDLSDEIANEIINPVRAHKWYLLSEDETTNTNHASFGANLMQIFPLTCAVPDLSTITEMSKENDSRKPTLEEDGDTRNDLDSQSMF